MKPVNKKLVVIILLLFIFLMFFIGCSAKYVVITWTVNEDALKNSQEDLDIAKLTGDESLIKFHESKVNKVLNNPIREEFEARKIIDYSRTSVRFIDLEGKEKFITAEKIEIQKQ